MPSIFSLLSTAFTFYRKQPVLNAVVFWFLFVPQAIVDSLGLLTESAIAQEFNGIDPQRFGDIGIALIIVTLVVFIYFMVWGQACILLVGKRMISSPAGRSRTSFSAVRSQARRFIGPLLLTSILRGIIALALALGLLIPLALVDILNRASFITLGTLLLLPSVVFFVRTIFYDIVIVSGKAQYFAALKESNALVRTAMFRVLFTVIGLSIIILFPAAFVDGVVNIAFAEAPMATALPLQIFSSAVSSFTLMLYLLTSVALYKAMKEFTS